MCSAHLCFCECSTFSILGWWNRHFQLVFVHKLNLKALIEFWHLIVECFYLRSFLLRRYCSSTPYLYVHARLLFFFVELPQINVYANAFFLCQTVCVLVWLMINCHADSVLLFNWNYTWNYFTLNKLQNCHWLVCSLWTDGEKGIVDEQIKFCNTLIKLYFVFVTFFFRCCSLKIKCDTFCNVHTKRGQTLGQTENKQSLKRFEFIFI